MSKYDGWSLDSLWSELNSIKTKQGKAAGKEERLRRAYNNTKDPMNCSKDVRKSLPKMTIDGGGPERWKGNSRKKFDSLLMDAEAAMKSANNDLDDYRDAIETARAKAQRQSGLYVPVISDIYTAIKKAAN